MNTYADFPRFDPALGTLISTSFDYVGDVDPVLTLQDVSPGAYSATAYYTRSIFVPDGSVLYDEARRQLRSWTNTVVGVDGSCNQNCAGTPYDLRFRSFPEVDPIDGLLKAPAAPAFFQSPNRYFARATFDFFVTGPSFPGGAWLNATSVNGGIVMWELEHTYEPIPEPSTALLTLLGLTGLSYRRRLA